MGRRVSIKFCGMRSKSALKYAIGLNVDYLGFVIDFPKSPRSITLREFHKTAEWLRKNKKGKYKLVAVTVNMSLKNIQSIVDRGLTNVIQLHGNEGVEYVKKIKGIELWKAWNRNSKGNIWDMAKAVNKILLDSGDATQKALNRSGIFDAFALYKKLKNKKVDIVLSGGIDNGNVGSYLQKLKPSIIDVSRGIESAPGKKSKRKMKEFMNTVNVLYGK